MRPICHGNPPTNPGSPWSILHFWKRIEQCIITRKLHGVTIARLYKNNYRAVLSCTPDIPSKTYISWHWNYSSNFILSSLFRVGSSHQSVHLTVQQLWVKMRKLSLMECRWASMVNGPEVRVVFVALNDGRFCMLCTRCSGRKSHNVQKTLLTVENPWCYRPPGL